MLFCEAYWRRQSMNTLGSTLFFLLVAEFNDIFGNVRKMKEIIIVAGKSKADVCWVRHCLREHGYDSIPCKSAEQIIEEIEVLPTCDASVPLMIIEPQILRDVDHDLLAKLSGCSLAVPILLFNETDVSYDLAEVFEKICEYRMRFRPEQNPSLANVLTDAGVEVSYG